MPLPRARACPVCPENGGYDTIHATAPCAFSIELNGEFSGHPRKNALDYCTWDTEAADNTPPDLFGCNLLLAPS